MNRYRQFLVRKSQIYALSHEKYVLRFFNYKMISKVQYTFSVPKWCLNQDIFYEIYDNEI